MSIPIPTWPTVLQRGFDCADFAVVNNQPLVLTCNQFVGGGESFFFLSQARWVRHGSRNRDCGGLEESAAGWIERLHQ